MYIGRSKGGWRQPYVVLFSAKANATQVSPQPRVRSGVKIGLMWILQGHTAGTVPVVRGLRSRSCDAGRVLGAMAATRANSSNK